MIDVHSAPNRGRLFVISAPSGAGKTSLVKALMERDPSIRFSVSYTTRPRRPTEASGRDYIFVDKDTFHAKQRAGDFLEHATVFDHEYATGRQEVEQLLDAGHDVILEIDWQGAAQVRERMPECVSVFILPPSRESLATRLRKRDTDTDAVIERRLRDAVADISHWHEFDYVIVNADFETALTALRETLAGRGDRYLTTDPEIQAFAEQLLTAK